MSSTSLSTPRATASWYGYPVYFTQVLLNLLSNAEHHAYRDAGGPVDIVLERRSDRLHVTVADRGMGIPKGDLDNVVDQLPSPPVIGGSRTGLGMAVVYSLVTSGMHGTLQIDSEVGVGTRVHLDLPWRWSRLGTVVRHGRHRFTRLQF